MGRLPVPETLGMTKVYVSRTDGNITGAWAGKQVGASLEEIDENAEEVQVFLNPKKPVSLTDYGAAVQSHIDTMAKSREFNDGVTAATYLTSTIPRWKADAEAF